MLVFQSLVEKSKSTHRLVYVGVSEPCGECEPAADGGIPDLAQTARPQVPACPCLREISHLYTTHHYLY